MISGLSFDYTHARIAARLAQRPDERLWAQLRTARSVPALLDAMRASGAASTVSGIPAAGDGDAIELAFRQQLRTRIAEVADWTPSPWRAAVLHARNLLDLPALLQLASDDAPPRWIAADPVLARYALAAPAQRRAELAAGPLAPLAAALEAPDDTHAEPIARALRRLRTGATLHRLVSAWERQWRRLWPRIDDDARAGLDAAARALRAHLLRFPAVALEDVAPARQALATTLVTLVRRSPGQPAAVFAYLAVFAIDLERLRGEFVLRARPLGSNA